MKLTTNFRLEEFVPCGIYDAYKDNSIWFLDRRIVAIAEFIRDEFDKPMTINNWHSGGHFHWRGYRTPSIAIGAKFSQHRLGRAIDFNIQGLESDEVYDHLMAKSWWLRDLGVGAIEHKEKARTWTHIDLRWHKGEEILIV